MMYGIDRHPLVWRDIDDIADYVGQYAGLEIAERKTYEIERSIANLREFPHTGAPRDDVVEGLRMTPSASKAVTCFMVNDKARIVRIICVTYAGQDWQRIARERRNTWVRPSRSLTPPLPAAPYTLPSPDPSPACRARPMPVPCA
jgi:toxin ParE1/3/4